MALLLGNTECGSPRFAALRGCPLESVVPRTTDWTSVVAVAGWDMKMSATAKPRFGRCKVRGFWKWETENAAVWNDSQMDTQHTPRIHVVYNQSFDDQVARSCSGLILEFEGDYQVIPMINKVTLVPDRVRLAPQ